MRCHQMLLWKISPLAKRKLVPRYMMPTPEMTFISSGLAAMTPVWTSAGLNFTKASTAVTSSMTRISMAIIKSVERMALKPPLMV